MQIKRKIPFFHFFKKKILQNWNIFDEYKIDYLVRYENDAGDEFFYLQAGLARDPCLDDKPRLCVNPVLINQLQSALNHFFFFLNGPRFLLWSWSLSHRLPLTFFSLSLSLLCISVLVEDVFPGHERLVQLHWCAARPPGTRGRYPKSSRAPLPHWPSPGGRWDGPPSHWRKTCGAGPFSPPSVPSLGVGKPRWKGINKQAESQSEKPLPAHGRPQQDSGRKKRKAAPCNFSQRAI